MAHLNRPVSPDIERGHQLEMGYMRNNSLASIKRRRAPPKKSNHRKSLNDLGEKWNLAYKKMKKFNEDNSQRLWSTLMKAVEDKLGVDATTYFAVVAWLFRMHVPAIMLVLFFLFTPQICHRFLFQTPPGFQINGPFYWHDFFTGENWLKETELFQGYYYNSTIGNSYYDMPTAYISVTIICYFTFIILLAKSFADSFSEKYVEQNVRRGHDDAIKRKIFCFWNYSICNKARADVCRANILEELRKALSKQKKQSRTGKQLIVNIVNHIVISLLILGVGVGIFFITVKIKYSDIFLQQFATSLMTSVASVVLPPIFSLLGRLEHYESRNVRRFVPLFRNFALQTILFFTFVFLLFSRVVCYQTIDSRSVYSNKTFAPICKQLHGENQTEKLECWETWFGQEIYRFQIVDFFCVLVLSFFFLCVRRMLLPLKLWRASVVDVEQMVMHLLLTQCFVWFGFFSSPLLPLIHFIKLALSFLWFRLLVTTCCRPSNKPWKSQLTMNFFRVAIAFGFILSVGGAAAAVALLKHSKICGPFKGYDSILDIIEEITGGKLIKGSQIATLIMSFFNSFGFNVFFTICWLVLLLLMRRNAQAKRESLKRIEKTIKSITKDEDYFQSEVRKYNKRNPYRSKSTIPLPKDKIKRTPSGTSIRSMEANDPLTNSRSSPKLNSVNQGSPNLDTNVQIHSMDTSRASRASTSDSESIVRPDSVEPIVYPSWDAPVSVPSGVEAMMQLSHPQDPHPYPLEASDERNQLMSADSSHHLAFDAPFDIDDEITDLDEAPPSLPDIPPPDY